MPSCLRERDNHLQESFCNNFLVALWPFASAFRMRLRQSKLNEIIVEMKIVSLHSATGSAFRQSIVIFSCNCNSIVESSEIDKFVVYCSKLCEIFRKFKIFWSTFRITFKFWER